MKKIMCMLAVAAAVAAASACSPNQTPEATPSPAPVQTMQPSPTPQVSAPAASEKVIAESAVTAVEKNLNKVSEYKVDLDGDKVKDTVTLYTSANKDSEGEFEWDDGQKWLLEVSVGSGYYTLFDDYVSLGNVYFEYSDYYMDGQTVPVITLLKSESANFAVKNFVYDAKTKQFTETTAYDSADVTQSGINLRFSSIPDIR